MRNEDSWIIRLYAWLCQRLYHELAWSYDWVSRAVSAGRMGHWRRRALAHLPPGTPDSKPHRILEIGFGTGELLIDLAHQGHTPYGVELSPAMHWVTQRKFQRSGLHLPTVRSRAQAMPFTDGSFAAIVATFPTPYILDEQTLCECARLLASGDTAGGSPGGRLIIVGLWVALRPRLLARLVPVFYGEPPVEFMRQVEQRLTAAGFVAEWAPYQDGLVVTSVLIGQLAARPAEQQVSHATRHAASH